MKKIAVSVQLARRLEHLIDAARVDPASWYTSIDSRGALGRFLRKKRYVDVVLVARTEGSESSITVVSSHDAVRWSTDLLLRCERKIVQ